MEWHTKPAVAQLTEVRGSRRRVCVSVSVGGTDLDGAGQSSPPHHALRTPPELARQRWNRWVPPPYTPPLGPELARRGRSRPSRPPPPRR
ncbi:unnamed protein product [Rangifer tarandus platyrhynchus]|uniref:Uncharacterized protein n=1 Tax=Rangifer tarandus platyrhynchus TaxID=3082113 RepID=A0ABN8XQR6_RANTA|nr:unnamed protein product [Rangifer tarandus platyrhynchus]